MAQGLHTHKLTPRIAGSALYVSDTGSANHVTAVTIPDGAIAVTLWFDNAGTKVRGRVGFAGEDASATVTAADSDTTLGFHPADVDNYDIGGWAKVLHVATPSANVKVFGTWSY